MEYESIIGLEVHVELKTKSKMFCGCPAEHFGTEPNSQTCPVCLGLPGALPVPNRKAVEWTVLLGLALNAQINPESKFDRKHYFYPDLPKGYQISQYDQPIAVGGWLEVKSQITNNESQTNHKIQAPSTKRIRVRRVHLEEDTGKLLHSNQIPNYDGAPDVSLVDFNRSGVPLVEIVTEPDFRSSEEAKEFLKKIQLVVRYLDISDADMEKGSMRIEPSVSIREIKKKTPLEKESSFQEDGEKEYPGYRVEIKNINSFRFAQKAIDCEITRQKEILESGGKIEQETRGWNEAKNQTVGQRSKEEAHDYRYFPEPDIPPLEFSEDQISEIRCQIPELPDVKKERYVKELGIKETDAEIIVSDLATAKYFEAAIELGREKGIEAQGIANSIVNRKMDVQNQSPIQLIISMARKGASATLSEDEITRACRKVMGENPKVVAEIKSGKKQALQFLVGRVMKETKGGADPVVASRILLDLLKSP